MITQTDIAIDTIIAAAESEDAVGTVLRMHLITEELITLYLSKKRIGEIATYAKEPREFSGKLSMAVAFGLPIALVRPAHQINVIRNKLAHKINSPLHNDDLEELVRKVNLLVDIDPAFKAIHYRTITLPTKTPGKIFKFGEGDTRIDFVINFLAYYEVFEKWLRPK